MFSRTAWSPCWNSGPRWSWPRCAPSPPAPSGKWCTLPTWQPGRICLSRWALRGWCDGAPSAGWGTAGWWALESMCQTPGCRCCSPLHLSRERKVWLGAKYRQVCSQPGFLTMKWSLLTFEVDLDDVAVAHQVATGQQLRHFRGVGANHLAHPVARDAVRAETQAGVRVHSEHVLLQECKGLLGLKRLTID